MNTASRVLAFVVALAVIFGGGWAAGRAAGPLRAQAAHGTTESAPAAPPAAAAHTPAGLAVTQNGYTLVPQTDQLAAGVTADYRFRITDATGTALTRFAVVHDKRLHLIVVRRDGAEYRHVHPDLSADGTWSVPLTLAAAGSYRVFADFRPEDGTQTTLGADLQVAGDFRPSHLVQESRTATVAGYEVRLDGDLTAGASSPVRAVVTSQRRPVTDLQPYLGAYGHLVALRGGDFAYLHVHPDGAPGDGRTTAGPAVAFAVEVPSPGRYLLFLDFQHAGQVHTAPFVLDAKPGAPPADPGHGGGHGGTGGHGDTGGHGG